MVALACCCAPSRRTQGACPASATGCLSAPSLLTQMSYLYDDFGRTLSETDPLGRTWATQYDLNNNPVMATDATGQVTTYSWGYGHRLATRTNLAAGNLSQLYNPLGQLTQTQVKQPGSSTVDLIRINTSYDAAHRIDVRSDTRSGVLLNALDYDYSPGGRLNRLTDKDQQQTDYVYDASGRLSALWASHYGTTTYRLDAGGRLLEQGLPSGGTTRTTSNPDNTLSLLSNRSPSGSLLSQHLYQYDAYANRRLQQETLSGLPSRLNTYTYDSLNQLIKSQNGIPAQDEAYGYDARHNLTSISLGTPVSRTDYAIVDGANQLLALRAGSPTGPITAGYLYDLNGSLIKKCTGPNIGRSATTCFGSGASITDLSLDSLDRLIQVDQTGLPSERYAYDANNRRIQKTLATTPTAATTHYLYDGDALYAEYGTSFTSPTALYTQGPGIDAHLSRQTGSGPGAQVSYYQQDGLGSVVAQSNSAGTIQGSQRFDAWGNPTGSSGSAIQTYGYTGREPDATGLIYYRARYYDPSMRRFTQRDPIGFAGGLNQYAYVQNNPVNFTDPFGLRGLTEGEVSMMSPIFGSSVLQAIDVHEGAGFNPIAQYALNVDNRPAITLGETIYVQSGAYQDDFSTASSPRSRGLLVHETTHVMQNQTDGFISTAAGSISENLTQGNSAYNYTPSPSSPDQMGPPAPLSSYGVEQQAALVEDYYYLTTNESLIGAPGISVTDENRSGYEAIYQGTLSSAGLARPGQQSLYSVSSP